MRRRTFLAIASAVALAPSATALAQSRIYRIGLLNKGAPPNDTSPFGSSLVRGFARLGYVQGRNLVLERRGAEGDNQRLPRLVGELLELDVDVIIALGHPAASAAKQQTRVPVVVFSAGDPVEGGLVESLAKPGGHLTGVSDVSAELTPKRMELLRDIVPGIRRVAVFWNADDVGMTLRFRASQSGAKAMGIEVQPLGVRSTADFERAFGEMSQRKPNAILMIADSLMISHRKRVFDYAMAQRLPAIYEADFLVRDGGLMSYGPDFDESLGRLASLVDRILKGAKPASLPFEQPSRFRLAINLKAAKALGLEVPASLIDRADEVIE